MAFSQQPLRRNDGDAVLGEAVDGAALAEDLTFAGPAPDDALEGEIVDPQADMPLIASPKASLLRFITCGSVDDGKSTLIGRLLYDTASVFDDQLEALEKDSRKFGTTGDNLDFALLVDGLSAEREQGITIDVAYRYFSTANRAFIIADTPGHEQYTRNMATGASQADLAVILVDARKGLLPQTRRHSLITSMVGIKSVVVAVNKMDLVGFDEAVFHRIVADYNALLPALGFAQVAYIPLSAKNGDNLASRSPSMGWYEGPTLLEHLETVVPPSVRDDDAAFRLPVQWVNRPNLDFRGFSGTIASGRIAVGDTVVSLPSGQESRVREIIASSGEVESAGAAEAVTLRLTSEIDASRGDVLVASGDTIRPHRQIEADILWMVDRPLVAGGRLIAKLGTAQSPASVRALREAVDIHSYGSRAASALLMNEIGRVTISFDRPMVATTYAESRDLGAFILIDSFTNETVALGVVTGFTDVQGARTETPTAVPAAGASGLVGSVKAAWMGSAARRPAVRDALVRFRAIAAVLVGILALLLGLPLFAALILGVADFALRPLLWRVLAPAPTPPVSVDQPAGAEDLGDGAGI